MSHKNQPLRIARIEKELSQADLGICVGVSRQTIGLIEKGDYNPSLNLCKELCRVLEKSLNELFGE